MNKVQVTETSVVIPTYKPCTAEKGPLFIEKRAYQGSSGKVYPLAVTEKISDKREDVSTFPIATGEYYKYDYSAGIDISRYKNIKIPASYMAAHSDFDFIGNYDEKEKAGLLHAADHHVSPGKKQWTWGNGDFGRS